MKKADHIPSLPKRMTVAKVEELRRDLRRNFPDQNFQDIDPDDLYQWLVNTRQVYEWFFPRYARGQGLILTDRGSLVGRGPALEVMTDSQMDLQVYTILGYHCVAYQTSCEACRRLRKHYDAHVDDWMRL